MRLVLSLLVLLTVLIFPVTGYSARQSGVNAKPQSAANYPLWPGIVDVVNLPTRQHLSWVNGNEYLSYRGDTEALIATLIQFAKIKSPRRRVVYRPGPLFVKLKGSPDLQYDWQLHIVGGIVRGMVKHNKAEMAWDMDPTLIVYVTDRLDLTKIQIPDGVEVEEIADLRARYETALRTGNEPTKRRAEFLLGRLDNDAKRAKLEPSEYNSQVKQIHKFVQHVRTRAK